MTVYDDLGLAGVINGVGPATRLGGLPLADEVWAAMREAAATPVHLADLQRAAGAEAARLLGAPAAYVTSGAFAALTLAAAVCLTGDDPTLIDQLPRASTRRRFVMQRAQRDPYDRAIEVAGGRIVDIGYIATTHPGELEAALSASAAAVLYRPGYPGNLLDLATVTRIPHDHQRPVIVDAALVVPPVSVLHELLATGADLIAVSGGKGFRGPQASGLLLGRLDLIEQVELHHQDMDERATTWHRAPRTPPRHGIGRGMKTGREQIVGLLTAIRRYLRDPDADNAAGLTELEHAATALSDDPRIVITRRIDPHLKVPVLDLLLAAPTDVDAVVRELLALPVPVHLGQQAADAGILTVNPMALQAGHGQILARSLIDAVSRLT